MDVKVSMVGYQKNYVLFRFLDLHSSTILLASKGVVPGSVSIKDPLKSLIYGYFACCHPNGLFDQAQTILLPLV